jgi:hypothetical protein
MSVLFVSLNRVTDQNATMLNWGKSYKNTVVIYAGTSFFWGKNIVVFFDTRGQCYKANIEFTLE